MKANHSLHSLVKALREGDIKEEIELLETLGIHVNHATAKSSGTALYLAVGNFLLDHTVSKSLTIPEIDFNVVNKHGGTPPRLEEVLSGCNFLLHLLVEALRAGDIKEEIELLETLGIHVNHATAEDDRTAPNLSVGKFIFRIEVN